MQSDTPTGDSEARVSKSQRKRDSTACQVLAGELVQLPREQLNTLPLPEAVLAAIVHAQSITKHGARKRQLKFIGGLLRQLDTHPIRESLARIHRQTTRTTAQHHRTERWRDRLLQEDDTALQEWLNEYPAAADELQQIRQMIRAARREAAANKPPRAARNLFRFLRERLK